MHFSEPLEVEEKLYSFSFSDLPNPGPRKYFVRVSNRHSELVCFEMKKRYDHWVVLEPAPAWVLQLEEKRSHLIQAKQTSPAGSPS